MTVQSFEEAFKRVRELVTDFRQNERYFLSSGYSEIDVRRDFLDKFWYALGWDVYHETQKNPYQQEVKVERNVDDNGRGRRADYAFLMPNFRDVSFFVEAKKPSRNLDNADDYFQAIRYGWNARTPLAILTDFEQFRVLDCRYKPDIDSVLHRLLDKYHYTEYVEQEKFAKIYYLFSREAVADGSLERYAESLPKASGKAVQRTLFAGGYQSIDESFLQELDGYREQLAHSFKRKNPHLNSTELTEVTQRTLDRLVFMRFLEDKVIETEPLVEALGRDGTAWQDFIATSRRLNRVYNGIIFKEHALLDTSDFQVDERVFADIRESLAHTNSPYDFNAIPIHILGNIYERFLGKAIIATDKSVKIEEKQADRKESGVYYTPAYIVRYLVEHTIGPLIEGKTPEQIRKMRFADIACGSGSFLLGVFDFLLRYHTTYFNASKSNYAKGLKAGCIEHDDGLHLSLLQKRDILLNNIYGVDIDPQAVEVAQLSLYLKLLEEETLATARNYQLTFREALLPSLDKNIKCGNSLIDWDILEGHLFEPVEERKLNPMNVEDAFPQAMKNGGFDAIVGNPPYIRIQTMQKTAPQAVEYYKQHYITASRGNYDIYVVFVERALSLLNANGKLGYILPHKFFNAQYGQPLRTLLAKGKHLAEVVHFGDQQVFAGASTYTSLMVLNKVPTKQFRFLKVEDLDDWRETGTAVEGNIPASKVTSEEWNFAVGSSSALLAKLNKIPTKLENVTSRIFQGIKTSADKIYIVEELEREKKRVKVYSREREAEYWVEPDLLHPLIKGGDSKRYHLSRTNRLILFPYARQKNDSTELIPQSVFEKRYPLTWAYLLDNKEYLENRENGKMRGARWYGYVYPKALDVMPLPKIFTPDIAPRSSFSLDETGDVFFTGGVAGGYGILVLPDYSREYVLGLLNSKLLEWVIHQTATQMRGGWFSYESRFIRGLPIHIVEDSNRSDKTQHDKLINLVEQMLVAKREEAAARTDRDRNRYESKSTALERQIDHLVYELYGLTKNEIHLVESSRHALTHSSLGKGTSGLIRAAVEKAVGVKI